MTLTPEESFAPARERSKNALSQQRRTVAVTTRHRWVLRENVVRGPEDFLTRRAGRLIEGATSESLLGSAADARLLATLPSPFLLLGVREAAERLVRAMDEGEPIVIFGDYDVDGTTSCAMLRRFFVELGHPVDVYIPGCPPTPAATIYGFAVALGLLGQKLKATHHEEAEGEHATLRHTRVPFDVRVLIEREARRMAGYMHGGQIADSFMELMAAVGDVRDLDASVVQYLKLKDDPRLTEIFTRLQAVCSNATLAV